MTGAYSARIGRLRSLFPKIPCRFPHQRGVRAGAEFDPACANRQPGQSEATEPPRLRPLKRDLAPSAVKKRVHALRHEFFDLMIDGREIHPLPHRKMKDATMERLGQFGCGGKVLARFPRPITRWRKLGKKSLRYGWKNLSAQQRIIASAEFLEI